ncbi:hypothetical protein HPB48_017074 [Haemaphysalis longicornis]|uniref:Uncharacterized protein n=1 Tax=Haemaphysalis longicornis TaxID=44386 RepID=A0A9J6GBZ4_HAELO|nr:hypothetical protein HPB48_017074 [Haemaphysalis longicornis]
MWNIKHLRDKLNEMWQYTLIASVGQALCTACIGIYTVLDEDIPMSERATAAFYAISLVIDTVDIARLSQDMGDEVSTFIILLT